MKAYISNNGRRIKLTDLNTVTKTIWKTEAVRPAEIIS